MDTSTITSSWTRRFVAHARARGVDLRLMLREVAITEPVLDDPHGRVLFNAHSRLVDEIVAALDDPGVGIDVGVSAEAADFGVVALLAESRSTLGEALEAIQRFNAVANESSLMDYWVEGGRLFIRDGHHRDGRPMPAAIAEATLAYYATMIRQTTGVASPFEEVWLAHEEHRGWTPDRRAVFAAPLRFGSPFHAVVLPAALRDAPFVSARPDLSVHLTRLAQHLEGELAPAGEQATQVAAHVRRALAHGGPEPLDRVACALGTPTRTLQRHLEASGRSYSEIVDEVRRDLVGTLLKESSMKLELVAERAGYSDVRSFRRACVRWFGATPGSYRRAHR